jgi:putative membrane protein
MKMMYDFTYYYFGMHLIWWFVWGFILFWIFAIPFQRTKKNSPLDILKKRFASGEMSEKEYLENKKILKD